MLYLITFALTICLAAGFSLLIHEREHLSLIQLFLIVLTLLIVNTVGISLLNELPTIGQQS